MVDGFEKDYYDQPGSAHSYSGIDAIKRRFPFFSINDIEKLLSNIDAYSQHRTAKPIKYYNPHYVRTKRKQLSADLVDMHWISEENNNTNFLLIVLDNFTRMLFVRPLERKSAELTKAALKSIFDNDMSFPHKNMSLLVDQGTEFVNHDVKALCNSYGIRMEHAFSNKASQIERVALTLQRIIYIFMKQNNTWRYFDHLQSLVQGYNTRHHRMIKMSPIEAEISSNRNLVISALSDYWHKSKRKKKLIPKFKIGDQVRIQKKKTIFGRGYERIFARETFLVHKVHRHLNEPMYTLRAYDDETDILRGKFYQNELSAYTSEVFNVLKVIRYSKNKKKVLIQKEGFENPSWIDTNDLRALGSIA